MYAVNGEWITKYVIKRLKLERVCKYALRMANELPKSNTKYSKQFITLGI